jgi:hypothetical protein
VFLGIFLAEAITPIILIILAIGAIMFGIIVFTSVRGACM